MATEPEFTAKDGSIRKTHYGSGRQPWDDMVALTWAPDFAAANVLKYLRREKEREDSLKKANWYWNALHDLTKDQSSINGPLSKRNIMLLEATLTKEELALLHVDKRES